MTGTARGKKSGGAAAIEVLRKSGKARPVKEVVAAALADPQVTGLQGRTPSATLSAALYTEAKPDGAIVLAGRGWSRRGRGGPWLRAQVAREHRRGCTQLRRKGSVAPIESHLIVGGVGCRGGWQASRRRDQT
jgi:hypothetical protein